MKFTSTEFNKLRQIAMSRLPVKVVGVNKFGEPVQFFGVIKRLNDSSISIDLPPKAFLKKESEFDTRCSATLQTDIPKQHYYISFDDTSFPKKIVKDDFEQLENVNELFVYEVTDNMGNVVFKNEDAATLDTITRLNGSIFALQSKLNHRDVPVDDPVTSELRKRIGKKTFIYLGEGVGTKRFVINAICGLDDKGNVIVEVQNANSTKTVPITKETMIFAETPAGEIDMIASNNPKNRKERKALDKIYQDRLKGLEIASRVVGYYPDKEAKKVLDEMIALQAQNYVDLYESQKKRTEDKSSQVVSGIASRLCKMKKQSAPILVPAAVERDIARKAQEEQERRLEEQRALKKAEEEMANAKAKQNQPH